MREQTYMMQKTVCPECGGYGNSNSEDECRSCKGSGIVNYQDIAHFSSRCIFNSVTLVYLILYAIVILF